MSAHIQNPEDVLVWLEIRHHNISVGDVEGPFTNTEGDKDLLRSKLSELYILYNTSPTTAGADQTDPIDQMLDNIFAGEGQLTIGKGGKPAFTLTWTFEFVKEVTDRVKAATDEPFSLYTVIVPSLTEEPPLQPFLAEIRKFTVAGGQHFNLGPKVVTFLAKQDALDYGRDLCENARSRGLVTSRKFTEIDLEASRRHGRVRFAPIVRSIGSEPWAFVEQVVVVTEVTVYKGDRIHPTCT